MIMYLIIGIIQLPVKQTVCTRKKCGHNYPFAVKTSNKTVLNGSILLKCNTKIFHLDILLKYSTDILFHQKIPLKYSAEVFY